MEKAVLLVCLAAIVLSNPAHAVECADTNYPAASVSSR